METVFRPPVVVADQLARVVRTTVVDQAAVAVPVVALCTQIRPVVAGVHRLRTAEIQRIANIAMDRSLPLEISCHLAQIMPEVHRFK